MNIHVLHNPMKKCRLRRYFEINTQKKEEKNGISSTSI